jgi:hypothetical protein
MNNNKSPLDVIREFCKKNNQDLLHEKLLLYNYYEEYSIAVNKYSIKELTKEKIDTIYSTLLDENSLKKNLKLINSELFDLENSIRVKIEKKYKRTGFGLNVLAGVIASFIFTLLLIGLLAAADNQVKGIVKKYFTSNESSEKK